MSRRLRLAAAVALVLGAGGGAALAAFRATTSASVTFAASPDWSPPTVTSAVVQKAEGGVTGYVRPGGGYRVYASFADTGSPASGVASATSDTSAFQSSATASAMSSSGGPFTVAGTSYAWRTAALTVDSGATAGTRAVNLSPVDAEGNTTPRSGGTVVVDGTAPAGSDIQTTNVSGGTAGRAEAGDTIVFTFSEPVDPGSIVAGWTGAAATNVVVQLTDGGIIANDSFSVRNAANTAALPLTPTDVTLPSNLYTLSTVTFGATGTASSMTVSGSTVTVTLGTASAAANTGGAGAMTWTPGSALYDRAGNPASTGAVTEGGASDADF